MKQIVSDMVAESIRVKTRFFDENLEALVTASRQVAACFASGRKFLTFGNGGSASDAQHIAAEFVNRFVVERRPLPAIALSTDTSVLTSIANDYSFDEVFSKQIRALGERGDHVLAISTSGNSANVIAGVETARELGLYTIGLSGCGGGALGSRCDLSLAVDSRDTPRIQEAHILIGHLLCDLADRILFPDLYPAETS